MQLIQRKEKGDWHLRVCVGGKDFKINLKTTSKDEARGLLSKAIELGGDAVKTQALEDPDLQGVWVRSEGGVVFP